MTTLKNHEQLDMFTKHTALRKPAQKVDRKYPNLPCIKCLETFLSVNEVAARYDVSKAAIWRWAKRVPDFPKPIKLTPGTTRWKLSDLVSFEVKQEQNNPSHSKAALVGRKQ